MDMNLHRAVVVGSMEDASSALCSGSDPNVLSPQGGSLLAIAVSQQNAVLVDLLLRHGARVDLADGHGNLPICYAAALGWLEGLRLLLAAGAHVNGQCDCGSPLSVAVVDGQNAALSLLISAGANPDLRNADGFTPLMLAASNENVAAIPVLVKAGAVVDARDRHGLTAYLHSALQGDMATGRELLRLGADPKALSDDGKSALDIAAECGHSWEVAV